MTIVWAGDRRGYVLTCDEPGCSSVSEHNASSLSEALVAALNTDHWDVRSKIGHNLSDRCPAHFRIRGKL